MGNVNETVRSTGFDYWAAYVGGEKIKTRMSNIIAIFDTLNVY